MLATGAKAQGPPEPPGTDEYTRDTWHTNKFCNLFGYLKKYLYIRAIGSFFKARPVRFPSMLLSEGKRKSFNIE